MRARRPLGVLAASLSILLMAGALSAPAESEPAMSKQADLEVRKVGSLPRQVAVGERVTTPVRLRNVGTKKTSTKITLYLRKAPKARPSRHQLGSRSVQFVKPKQRRDIVVRGRVPQDLKNAGAGASYYVVACAPRRGRSGKARCAVSKRPTEIVSFSPGARTLGDPLFPQVGNGGYDAIHYDIVLNYDPGAGAIGDQAFLAGTSTTIEARATQGLSRLSFDFQRFDVSAVRVDGEKAKFAYAATAPLGDPAVTTQLKKLVITPATPIPDGDRFSVAIDYTGTPERIVDVDASSEGWIQACYSVAGAQTCDGAFVVNEPNGAQSFFPSNNYPTDKATFDTTLTVPAGKTAIGIGEQTHPPMANPDGTTSWSWSEDDPTATYLTTASVGSFSVEQGSILETPTGRNLPFFNAIDSSATAVQLNSINSSLQRTSGMIDFLSESYGPYPLDSTGAVVDRTTGVGYALEVQSKPHYASLHVGVTTHWL